MRILDADSMREVDRAAIDEIGIPSLVLMENAAIGVVDAIGESFPEVGSVAIFCGPGNNGGDGLAIARHLRIRGYEVEISLLANSEKMSGDAGIQLAICRQQGLPIRELSGIGSLRETINSTRRMDLVVDALFGTGLTRSLVDEYADLVGAINALPIPCVAVDLPSGLNGSSSDIMGPHIQADMTVTFAAPKVAHIFMPAAGAAGDVVVADLGIPRRLVNEAPGHLHLLTEREMEGWLPARLLDSHKGDYGHAVLVAGSEGKAGAAILAARGAIRAGAGLVTVATPRPVTQTVDLGSVESMTVPLETADDGGVSGECLEQVMGLVAGKQVLAIGPGLGIAPSTGRFVQALVQESEAPVVLDADGLNAFAGNIEKLADSEGERVLTPHPGELGRLLNVTSEEIQQDRVAAVTEAALKSRSIVVLKGHQTLIADLQGTVFVNTTGNPGMATGGVGDVLTGLIAGLVSQGLSPVEAACLGVFVHGRAGDRVAVDKGENALVAGDLLEALSFEAQDDRS